MEKKAKVTLSDKKVYWQNVLTEWERSGLSQAEFCRQRKITHSNFFVWRKRLKEATVELPSPLFSRVMIKSETSKPAVSGSSSTPLTLVLKNQLRLEVTASTDKDALKMVLDVLGVLPC